MFGNLIKCSCLKTMFVFFKFVAFSKIVHIISKSCSYFQKSSHFEFVPFWKTMRVPKKYHVFIFFWKMFAFSKNNTFVRRKSHSQFQNKNRRAANFTLKIDEPSDVVLLWEVLCSIPLKHVFGDFLRVVLLCFAAAIRFFKNCLVNLQQKSSGRTV